MPAVAVAVIQAVVAFVGGWKVVALTVATITANYITSQRQQRKMKRALAGLSNSGYLINTQSTEEPVRAVYGKFRVGGNIVYINAIGDNNEFLDTILTVSEGPVDSSVNEWLDDNLIGTFGSDAYYEFFNGDEAQGLCSTLQAADANWDDYMRFTSYYYIRLKYNKDKFNGLPKFTFEIKGRKLYDPRSGLTVWSDNPALVWYDIMTNARYGMGIDAADIDTQSVMDAANWCDTNSYTFNGVLFERQSFLDTLEDVLRNFRGYVIWSDGKYKLRVLDYDSIVMSLDEDEIVADSFVINVPGLQETPNRVKVQYPDIDEKYIAKDQIIADETAVLVDDLEERDFEIDLIGTVDASQANKLGVYYLERARINKTFTFAAHPRTLSLEPGDMIQVTHSLAGWTDRVVRVWGIGFAQDGLASLTVVEEDAALYDDIVNLSPHTFFETNLPSPLDIPPEATGISFAEEEYFNKDVSYTRLKVTFTNPDSPFWQHSEVWVNVDGAGYNHYTDAVGGLTIEPVKEDVEYKVKLVSVSIYDVKQNISTSTEWTHDVVGLNTPPDDVTNFRAIPQSDTIILLWDEVNNVDLSGYEIRKGTNWNGGIFIGFIRAVSFQMNGVAPGTHSYMVKSVDTKGKYSTNNELASATIYGPASYTEKLSEVNDYSSHAAWAATTAYSLGDRILPTTPNGYYHECTTAGTSGGSEPTWPTTTGNTVADGTVVWTCYEDQTFTNTEKYNDVTYGWILRTIHNFITNYNFETDTTGWVLGSSWARSNTEAYLDSYSIASPGDASGAGTETYKQDSEIAISSGETYTFQSWVWSDTASQARLKVRFETGVDNYSSYHTGDSTWQLLTVTVVVTTADGTPSVAFRKEIATGQAYFDDCKVYESDLTGLYLGPVYDRDSVVTRRSWPEFDLIFIGTGTVWTDQFISTDLWTDKFSGGDTWLTLFGAFISGILRMRFGYSSDGSSWSWVDNFESFVTETQARYVRYEITIIDVDASGSLYVQPTTLKEAYWS